MFVVCGPPDPSFSAVWSPIHGLTLVYAASIKNLGLKSAWSLKRIVLNLLAFMPILPFVAEARVTRSTDDAVAGVPRRRRRHRRIAGRPRSIDTERGVARLGV